MSARASMAVGRDATERAPSHNRNDDRDSSQRNAACEG
jgi:hypothetical protein